MTKKNNEKNIVLDDFQKKTFAEYQKNKEDGFLIEADRCVGKTTLGVYIAVQEALKGEKVIYVSRNTHCRIRAQQIYEAIVKSTTEAVNPGAVTFTNEQLIRGQNPVINTIMIYDDLELLMPKLTKTTIIIRSLEEKKEIVNMRLELPKTLHSKIMMDKLGRDDGASARDIVINNLEKHYVEQDAKASLEELESGEVKGILHIGDEISNEDDFVTQINNMLNTGESSEMPVMIRMDWEVDTISLSITSKEGYSIAYLEFDNTAFQNAADKIMPPTNTEMERQEQEYESMTEKEQEQVLDDVMAEQPIVSVRDKINALHASKKPKRGKNVEKEKDPKIGTTEVMRPY